MARVICKLPNAGTLINGVTFTEDRGEMISEEIPDEVAAEFAKIPGYTLVKAADAGKTGKAAGDGKKEA